MLLVIFGAGASYDSAPRLKPTGARGVGDGWRPPLTDELFADRPEFRDFLTDFPQVLPLSARLGQASASLPLEGMLSRLKEEAAEYPARHSELAAVRYYLQRLIWECERHWHPDRKAVTNYLALLDRVQRWRHGVLDGVLFTTFNYDRLFEYAASYYLTEGRQIYQNSYDTLASYPHNPLFPLIKLHGSLDWGYRVNTPLPIVSESNEHVWQIAWEVIRRFPDLDIAPDIAKTVERPPQPQDGHAYVPALAIPIDQKGDFACPSTHIDFLLERLPRVRSVLTIGWRGMDAHFVQMLATHLLPSVRIMTVSGSLDAGQETLNRLRTAGVSGNGEAYAGGFSEFVVSHDVDMLLSGA